MSSVITLADYEAPNRQLGQQREWIIVSAWGSEAEYLSIARTGVTRDSAGDAPDALQPKTTFLGLLASHEARERVYLMVRQLPPNVTVAGIYFPTDGYARLIFHHGLVSLVASGRHAHSRGEHMGLEVRGDVPAPAPRSDAATAWHMTGTSRRWVGEFFLAQELTAAWSRLEKKR